MSGETITVNQVGLYMSPTEWIAFREWAKLGEVNWDTPIELSKIEEFLALYRTNRG